MSLETALGEMMSRRRVLVGLDFDGVLAPIVDHPDLAAPHPAAVPAVEALSRHEGVDVVIVSGRARADLAERIGPVRGVELVGEHGNDTGHEEEAPPLVAEITAFLTELGANLAGSTVESKPHSASFHTRRLSMSDTNVAVRAIEEWARLHPDVDLLEGKEVLELSVGSATKGDVIAQMGRAHDGIVYIGDDLTDETVFVRLGPDDISIKVGEGETSARFRVSDVPQVVALLETMALAFG